MTDYDINNNILNGLNPNDNIYRVTDVSRFFDLVINKSIALVRPDKWDDPFENLLTRTEFRRNDKDVMYFATTEYYYGQCWTLNKECDGMWRNYASLDRGVKVRSTSYKLLNSIYNNSDYMSQIQYYVGKVEYLTDKQILNILRSPEFIKWVTDATGKNEVKTLLIKRAEFNYENEVRLLYKDIDNKHKDCVIFFNIDPIKFIDEVVFSPKMSNNMFNIYKDTLIRYGFNEDVIYHSKLYDPWEIKILNKGI